MLEALCTPLTYSPSITIPLTHDCPWHCAYCGYRSDQEGLISEAKISELFRIGKENQVTEILFMSGEVPDTLPHIRNELAARGYSSFIDFAVEIGQRALEMGFLPHTNIGALSEKHLRALKEVNVSQGLMLENCDELFNKMVAPEKNLAGRLKTMSAAGRAKIAYTSGILIGLGESHHSRRASLELLANLHNDYGHLQEIILQNYIPNRGSRWEGQEIALDEYIDLIRHWRQLAPEVAIQIPPNLNPYWRELLPYVDDLGGISTEGDLINPLSPWAQVEVYREAARSVGRDLLPRLPVYPAYLDVPWQSEKIVKYLKKMVV